MRYWYWYCPNEFSGIGIGIGVENFGIVYVCLQHYVTSLLPIADQSTYLYPTSFTPIQLKTSQKLTLLLFRKEFSAKVNSGKLKK